MRLTITHSINETIEAGQEIEIRPGVTFLVTGIIRKGRPKNSSEKFVDTLCEYTVKVKKEI